MTESAVTSANATVGVYAALNASMVLKNPVPTDGLIKIVFPKWASKADGATYASSMITEATVTTCKVAFNAPTFKVITDTNFDTLILYGAFAKRGPSRLDVIIEEVRNQPSLKPKGGFYISTTDG